MRDGGLDHIVLFVLASPGDAELRPSVTGLAISTAVGVTLLARASLFGGWRLAPHHFAERHGLILIIALGESIVAIGVGAAIVALGLKTAIGHCGEHLLGLVGFRFRHVRTLNRRRFALAIVLLILAPWRRRSRRGDRRRADVGDDRLRAPRLRESRERLRHEAYGAGESLA